MPTTYAIPNGRTVMNAITYSGTSASRDISNADLGTTGFKPDLVWCKSRTNPSSGFYNILCDTVRGQTSGYYNMLFSNTTDQQNAGTGALPASTGGITTFNTNGYTIANGSSPSYWQNESGYNYVAWQWQAGQGTTSSNTSGSVTSTVSVNATAGFSIVTYPGSASNITVGHGLGVAPSFIVIKGRDSTYNWIVYHASLGKQGYLHLNLTTQAQYSPNVWNDTAPTSTVFSVSAGALNANEAGKNFVAYCWAEIAGFSKFGSYTGNGSTDGTFVYTGFRPKFVMIKVYSTTQSWTMEDTSRDPYNAAGHTLWADLGNAEADNTSAYPIDLLSNGFKLRSSAANQNSNGANYIYAAFAENPFKYANAR